MSQLSAKCCPQISAIRSHPQHCQGGSQGKAPPSNLNTLSNYQTPTYKHVFDKRHTSEIFLVGSFSPCTVHVPIHQHHLDAIVKIIDNFKEKTKQNTHPRNLTTKGFFFLGHMVQWSKGLGCCSEEAFRIRIFADHRTVSRQLHRILFGAKKIIIIILHLFLHSVAEQQDDRQEEPRSLLYS